MNLRLPASKAGTLARLSYTPMCEGPDSHRQSRFRKPNCGTRRTDHQPARTVSSQRPSGEWRLSTPTNPIQSFYSTLAVGQWGIEPHPRVPKTRTLPLRYRPSHIGFEESRQTKGCQTGVEPAPTSSQDVVHNPYTSDTIKIAELEMRRVLLPPAYEAGVLILHQSLR